MYVRKNLQPKFSLIVKYKSSNFVNVNVETPVDISRIPLYMYYYPITSVLCANVVIN